MTNPLFTFGDVDGDGDTDIVLSSGKVLLSTSAGLTDSGYWVSVPGPGWLYAGDFNGDGRSDLVGASVLLSNGLSFDAAPGWTSPAGSPAWYVGDFNGDGRDDLFRVSWGVTGAEMHLSTGIAFVLSGGWTGSGPGSQGWYVGDFDGDGRSDILRSVAGLAGAEVLLSTGSSFSTARVWSTQGNLGTWMIGDINQDGKDDIIDAVGNVLLSDGGKFVGAGRIPLTANETIVSFGGMVDGQPTLVVSFGGNLNARRFDLTDLQETPAASIEGLPRIVSVNEPTTLTVAGLEDGLEARFIVSQNASAWSAHGSYVFQPPAEGAYAFTLQIRDAASGRLLLEQHGGREVAVYDESKGNLAASADRITIIDVPSTVSSHASEREWRGHIHSFTDLHEYVSSAFTPQPIGSENMQQALFLMQFVSGMWAYGNLNDPDRPGEVTDNEITGQIPTTEIDADLFINSPLAGCEDYASVLATLLTMSGYQNRIVINPSHVFNEALIDGQWWVLDATLGIAIDTPFDTALSSESNPSVFVFSQATRTLGSAFRERAAEALQEHLSLLEHGVFPNAVRMDIITFLNLFPYSSVFTSELDLTGWMSTPTVPIAQDPGALTMTELVALASVRRLSLHEVSSEVSEQAAANDWRHNLNDFADFAQFLRESAPPGGSDTDRALFYMEWISGLWGLGDALSPGTAADSLSSPTASPTDRVALLSWLLEREGLDHRIAIEDGAALAEVRLDGQLWTLDPTTGIAIKSDWASAAGTHSEPEIYIYPVAGRQFGSSHYSANLGAALHETLTRIANGSFAGNTSHSDGWLLDHAFGRSILLDGAFDAGDASEDDPVKVIDLIATLPDAVSLVEGTVAVLSTNLARTVEFTLADGSISIDPGQFGDLDSREHETVNVSYEATTATGTPVSRTVALVVRGADDQPTVSTLDTGSVSEDDPVKVIDLLAGTSDSDGDLVRLSDGSVAVTSSNAARTVQFTLAGGNISIDPVQFGDLDTGESETVTISYAITDGDGEAVANTATLVVTGADDQPTISTLDTGSVSEDDPVKVIDLLAGASDSDGDLVRLSDGSVAVTSSNAARTVQFTLAGGNISIDPAQFGDLDTGESETVTISYAITDGDGEAVANTATLVVTGADDAPPFRPDGIWGSAPSTGWYVGDFDGDGKDDVFQYVKGVSGAQVDVSDGTQFTADGSWTSAWDGGFSWHVGDFDGDGRDDIFRYLYGSSGADMLLSDGSSFYHDGSWTPAGRGTAGWHVGDFNGDGKDDIFRYLPGTSGADMFLSTGDSFTRVGSWTPAGNGTAGWKVGDFNGDGKDDILRVVPGSSTAEVFLSTGLGFERSGGWLPDLGTPSNWLVGDFNGDGKDDLLRRGNDELEIFLSDGRHFDRYGSMADPGGALRLGNFNGDSRTDLLFLSPDGTQSSVYLSDWPLPA